MGKRGILFLGAAGIVFGCGFLWHWLQLPAQQPAPQEILLADGAQRLAFLEAQGQSERCCVATETVQLPYTAGGTYRTYTALQEAQRLPLAAHLGEHATRYTYTQSSPGQDHLCTELLLSEDQILLGAIQYDCAAPEQMSAVILHDPIQKSPEHLNS